MNEFTRREQGFHFYNNGTPTYITGTHYMYLQWSKIDVGAPEYREANRLFFIFWEACKADTDVTECILKTDDLDFRLCQQSLLTKLQYLPMQIRYTFKVWCRCQKNVYDKVVPISVNYPFLF